MTKIPVLSFRKRSVLVALTCLLQAMVFSCLSAQSGPDFSGTWVQDINKSDDFYKDVNVLCNIMHTGQLITVKTTFTDNTGTELVTRQSTFSLEGKEIIDNEGAKKSVKWSADKKTLVTSDTKYYGGDLVGVTASYTLSEDGLVLTVKTSDIKPEGRKITQVFNKKQ